MKNRFFWGILALILAVPSFSALASCDNSSPQDDYEQEITLTKDNYTDYLSLQTKIEADNHALIPYYNSELIYPVVYQYVRPIITVKTTTKEEENYVFKDVKISFEMNYVCKYCDSSYPWVTQNDIKSASDVLNVSESGSALCYVLNHGKDYGMAWICGYINAYAISVSGKVCVKCVHNFGDGEIHKQPTCTEPGTMISTCSKCGKKLETEVEALGHDIPDTPTSTTPATCTEEGLNIYKCSRCDEKVTRPIDPLGHSYKEEDAIIVPATCTHDGSVEYTCERCHEKHTDVLRALGHSFTHYDEIDPSCTEDGYSISKCDRCDETDIIKHDDTKLGHEYDEHGNCIRCGELNPDLKVQAVQISNESLLVEIGKPVQITFDVLPSNAVYKDVSYKILQNNTCEAEITEDGILTCHKVGSVTIGVTIDGGEVSDRETFYVPQLITTPEELFNVRYDLSGVYMLDNDLDISGYEKWTPIGYATRTDTGSYDYTNAFSGKFVGNGHTISGLNLDLEDSDTCGSLLTVGLFGSLSRDGLVSDVNLEDVNIIGSSSSADYIGSLVGFNPGTIEKASVTGSINLSNGNFVGGIIGENIGIAKELDADIDISVIANSYNEIYAGTIAGRSNGGEIDKINAQGSVNIESKGRLYIGGAVGHLVDKLTTVTANVELTVHNLSSSNNYIGVVSGYADKELSNINTKGSITATFDDRTGGYVGGVVGYANKNINNCKNEAEFNIKNSKSEVYLGGIAGYSLANIDNCENSVSIDLEDSNLGYIGGIAGKAYDVTNCHNYKDIIANGDGNSCHVAGIVGEANLVENCINEGAISVSNSGSNNSLVAGIVGKALSFVSKCENKKTASINLVAGSSSELKQAQYAAGVVANSNQNVSECKNNGNIDVRTNGFAYVGGIAGRVSGAVSSSDNLCNEIIVKNKGTDSTSPSYIGGVAGYMTSSSEISDSTSNIASLTVHKDCAVVGGVFGYADCSITNAKSNGNIYIKGTKSSESIMVGGVVGRANYIEKCFAVSSYIQVEAPNQVYAGGLVGYADEILESYAYPNVSVDKAKSAYVGGLVGYASKISKSYAVGNVKVTTSASDSSAKIGGLAGFVSSSVEESYANGDVYANAKESFAGGLVGHLDYNSKVKNSYSANAFIKTDTSSLSTGTNAIAYNGGLVGLSFGSILNSYAANYCYSVSNGSSNSHVHYVGGLVGSNNDYAYIGGSYTLDALDKLGRTGLEAVRDVYGSGSAAEFYAGGLVGINWGSIENSYSYASVNTTVSGAYTGGLIGYNNYYISNSIAYGEVNSGISGETTGGFAGGSLDSSSFASCFYSTESTKQSNSIGSGSISGITGLTNSALRTKSTYSNYSENIWKLSDNAYPTLIFGEEWENRTDGFNKYDMLVNVPNSEYQYQFPHSNRVSIKFMHNGIECYSTQNYSKGDSFALPKLDDYYDDGQYVFIGWCLDENFDSIITIDEIQIAEKSLTLYAYYCKEVKQPPTTTKIYSPEGIDMSYLYYSNESYNVSGDVIVNKAGTFTVTFKLNKGYCWSDSEDILGDYVLEWIVKPDTVHVPNIYSSSNYIVFDGNEKNLSEKYGNDYVSLSGDILINKTDELEHSVTISLKDPDNYSWEDGTNEDKVFTYLIINGYGGSGSSNSVAYKVIDDTLIIIGEGTIASNSSWKDFKNSITKVVISEGITTINSSTFIDFLSLYSVRLPSTLEDIYSSAFYGCYALSEIYNFSSLDLELGSSSYGYVAYYANVIHSLDEESDIHIVDDDFVYCSFDDENILVKYIGNDTTVVVPDDTTIIQYNAFYNCEFITSLEIPSSVKTINCLGLYKNSSLESITIPYIGESLDSDKKFFGYIFGALDGMRNNTYVPDTLKTVVILEGPTTIADYAFYGCEKIESIIIPESITSIGKFAFERCSSLKEFEIPDGVTSVGKCAFEDCSSLESIIIPDSMTLIGENAFRSCIALSEIALPNGIEQIGSYAFYGCSSLESLAIPEKVEVISAYCFYDCINLKQVELSNGLVEISGSAFQNCSSLESIIIPDSVTKIGNHAFTDCVLLKELTLSDSLIVIESHTFDGCSSLESVVIPESVTTIEDYAFKNCSSLETLIIPEGVTSIGSHAFEGCTSLKSVVIPESVAYIGESAFEGCTLLESVTIPESVKIISPNSFSNCYALNSVEISEGVENIEKNAFNNCSSLTSLEIPSSVVYIDRYALNGCSSLEKITLPFTGTTRNSSYNKLSDIFGDSGVPETLVEVVVLDGCLTIAEKAFFDCSSLVSVEIPASVTSIGNSAFGGCNSLEKMTLPFIGNSLESRQLYLGYIFGGLTYEQNSSYVPTSLKEVILNDGCTKIGNCAFYDCSYLTSVTIPDSVISIGNNAFAYCSSLTSIELPNSVTTIGERAFANCSSLTSIELSNSVTTIGRYAFADCSSLTSIELPNSVTTIDDCAFIDCKLFTSLVIPNSTTNVGFGVLEGCDSMESLTLPLNDSSTINRLFGSRYYYDTEYIPTSLKTIIISEACTSIGDKIFYNCSSVTSITIPNSVTSIGEYAFAYCSSLTSIELPNSVTTIGKYAFRYCSSLTSTELPNSVTTIGEYAFLDCKLFTSIVIPNSTTSVGSGILKGCDSLESLTLPLNDSQTINGLFGSMSYSVIGNIPTSLKTIIISEACTSIGDNIFYNCSSVTSITIPNSVITIGNYAFMNCSSLTSIELPNSVTTIGNSAFMNCSSLTSIELSNSVTTIGDRAFYNCSSLTSIIIPDSVTSIGEYAFYDCSSLTSILLPDEIDTIKTRLFSGCRSLMSVNIPNTVTTIDNYAFASCKSLTSIEIPSSVKTIGISAFQYSGLSGELIIPKGVTAIDSTAFGDCLNLTSVVISDSVTSIGSDIFKGCSSLQSLTLPFIGGSYNGKNFLGYLFGAYNESLSDKYIPATLVNITILDGCTNLNPNAFSGCSNLKEITIPKTITVLPSGLLAECTSLEKLTIPFVGESSNTNTFIGFIFGGSKYSNNDTKVPKTLHKIVLIDGCLSIGDFAFYNCSSLTSIELPNSVTTIGNDAFRNCSSLTSLELSNSVITIGNCAFEYCSSLTSIELPNSVTTIGEYAFYCCSSLTSILLPDEIDTIKTSLFSGCTSLMSVNIPNTVTTIGGCAFRDCSSLTSITIPSSVTSIEFRAFYNCSSLTSITIPSNVTLIGESAFYNCTSITIYCEAVTQPEGWATNWNAGKNVVWDCKNL